MRLTRHALLVCAAMIAGNLTPIADHVPGVGHMAKAWAEAAPAEEAPVEQASVEQASGLSPFMARLASAADVPAEVKTLAAAADAMDPEADPLATRDAWALAYEAAKAALPGGHLQLGRITNQYGAALFYAGDNFGAAARFEEAVGILDGHEQTSPEDLAEALGNLGSIYSGLGELTKAEAIQRRTLEIRRLIYDEESPEIARSYFELGGIVFKLGHVDEAVELVERALVLRQASLPTGHPHIAMTMTSLSPLLIAAGRYDEAESRARDALDLLEANLPSDHPFVAFGLNNLAAALNARGRFREAEPVFRRLLDIRRGQLGDTHEQLAITLNGLAFALVGQGRFIEAETLYQAAADMFSRTVGPETSETLLALTNAGDAAEAAGQTGDALALRTRVLASADQGEFAPDSSLRVTARERLGQSLIDTGQDPEAGIALIAEAQARRALWSEGTHPDYYMGEVVLGWAEARLGRGEGSERATTAIRALASLPAGPDQRRWDGLTARALTAAWQEGNLEAGFYLAQIHLENDTGAAIRQMTARLAAGSDALAAAVRDRQDIDRRLALIDRAYLTASGVDPERASALKAERVAALQERASLDAALKESFPAYVQLVRQEPLSLAQAQARLGPDEALLASIVTGEGVFVFALSREAAGWDKSPLSRTALRAEVSGLRGGLSMASLDVRSGPLAAGRGGRADFDLVAAHRLHEGLFTPAVRAVTDGKTRLVIVSDDALTSLPFAVLVEAPPAADTGYGEAQWLVRSRALVSLPTLSMLATSRPDADVQSGLPRGAALSGYLGIGAPVLEGPRQSADLAVRGAERYFRGGAGDVAAINALPALPEAEGELLSLAGLVGGGRAQILGGAAASEPYVKAAMSRPVSVMAFATHGLVTGELSGLAEPALVLTPPMQASVENDGLLTASEIATLRIDADWVILSACNTASGDGAGAPGLSGLAQAFFYAGGRSLLASHWPVRDDAAARLTASALRYASAGQDRAGALQRAMLDTMGDASLPDAAHPAVWAPFVYVGR